MKKTIAHKYGNQIIVTHIEQFSLPAFLHGDDIMDAITVADGYVQIDFHGFKCAMSVFPGRNTRDVIYGKALDYFRQFGVMLQGGTYCRIGWVDAEKHKPMHGETVLATGKGFTATAAWTGSNWLIGDGITEPITHWQRLPMSPEYEKVLEETP
jgi:hypothetical protein